MHKTSIINPQKEGMKMECPNIVQNNDYITQTQNELQKIKFQRDAPYTVTPSFRSCLASSWLERAIPVSLLYQSIASRPWTETLNSFTPHSIARDQRKGSKENPK